MCAGFQHSKNSAKAGRRLNLPTTADQGQHELFKMEAQSESISLPKTPRSPLQPKQVALATPKTRGKPRGQNPASPVSAKPVSPANPPPRPHFRQRHALGAEDLHGAHVAGCAVADFSRLFVEIGGEVGVHELWVQNGYPKWRALVNGTQD